MKRRTKKTWKIVATLSLVVGQFASFAPAVFASEVENAPSPLPTAPLVGEEVTQKGRSRTT